jgi:hypothetical protein
MNLKGTLAALALIAPLSAAPTIAQERPRPPPVDQAAALGEAQRLIKAADAEGLFEPGATPGGPVARHLKSGLVCRFELGVAANTIMVFDKGPQRGFDVGCTTRIREIVVTMYANRVSDIGDLAQAEAFVVSGMRKQWPDLKPYTGQVANMTAPGVPPIAVDRFLMTYEGRSMFTRGAAMRLGDWVFTQRVTAPEAVALAGDIVGGTWLVNLAKEVTATTAP